MTGVHQADKVRDKLIQLSPYSDHKKFTEENSINKNSLKLIRQGKEIFNKSFDQYSDEEKFTLSGQLIYLGFSSIQVNIEGWDTHHNNFKIHEEKGGSLDKGIGTLLKSLKEKDKFKETLILISGEFGRTPQIQRDGRNDYSASYSAAMISGAFKKGMQFGETSKDGDAVKNGITVQQMSHTALSMLGAPATIRDNDGINQLLPRGGGIQGFHLR
jgi:hypothetical protein